MDVVAVLDAQIASLRTELDRLERARAVLTAPASDPVPSAAAAPTSASAPPVPRPAPPPKQKPGPKPGNARGPGASPPGPSRDEVRRTIREQLSIGDPMTPTQLANALNLKVWKITEAIRDWDEVEHATESFKSPYRLKSRSSSPAPGAPVSAESVGPGA